MARSAGMMVNYVYRLDDVERNHERYFAEHAVVASRAVAKLARKSPLAAAAEKQRRGLSACSRPSTRPGPARSWPRT